MQKSRPPRPLTPAERLSLPRLIPVLALSLALAVLAHGVRAAELTRAVAATLAVYSDDLDESFLGSAFLWGDGQVAVTNAHVVGEARRVELRTRDGRRLSAPVIARDPGRDIAVIRVEGAAFGPGLEPARTLPEAGAPVYAIGAPLGVEFTVTVGMISAIGRQVEPAVPVRYLQHDAAVNPGSSGGPLMDASGMLIGMNSQIADGSRMFVGIAYAMTSDDISRWVPALLTGDLRPVPDLGLRVRPVSRRIAAALDVAPGEGLLVDQAVAAGVGGRSGILAGDILVEVDGQPIRQTGDLAFLIDARAEAAPTVTLLRQGERLTITLNLAPVPAILAALNGPQKPEVIASYSLGGTGIALDGLTVTGTMPGSPAQYAGLADGDELLAINGTPIADIDLAAYRVTGPQLILVRRGGSETLHVVVDPWSQGRAPRPIGGANVLDPAVVLF